MATKMISHTTKQTEILRRAEISPTLSLWGVCHLVPRGKMCRNDEGRDGQGAEKPAELGSLPAGETELEIQGCYVPVGSMVLHIYDPSPSGTKMRRLLSSRPTWTT